MVAGSFLKKKTLLDRGFLTLGLVPCRVHEGIGRGLQLVAAADFVLGGVRRHGCCTAAHREVVVARLLPKILSVPPRGVVAALG